MCKVTNIIIIIVKKVKNLFVRLIFFLWQTDNISPIFSNFAL